MSMEQVSTQALAQALQEPHSTALTRRRSLVIVQKTYGTTSRNCLKSLRKGRIVSMVRTVSNRSRNRDPDSTLALAPAPQLRSTALSRRRSLVIIQYTFGTISRNCQKILRKG